MSDKPETDGSSGEPEKLLDHDYDGIQEFDNPMPRWWVLTFWATFVFAGGYLFHYHIVHKGPSVAETYAADMREAREIEAKRALKDQVSEESLAKLMADGTTMADAKVVYDANCLACHSEQGKGLIGPNLTDDYWLHGAGSLMDIHGIVSNGVTAKGMPAWGRQLSEMELRKVVAYIGTLRGKHLAGKAPEGKKIGGESTALPPAAGDGKAASLTKP